MASRSLKSKESHETFISLLQLDPSPIDADTDKELPPLPEESSPENSQDQHVVVEDKAGFGTSGISSQLGLSGSGHGPIYYLTRVQKYSSYAFAAFTALHLANTSVIPLLTRSVSASETYLIQAREIYQSPLTEPLLVGLPVLAHVASGVALRLVRRSQNLRRYGGATPGMYALHRARTADSYATGVSGSSSSSSSSKSSGSSSASRKTVRLWPEFSYIAASGHAFLLAFGAHVAVNRILPLVYDGDSSNIGLGFVSHGFARHGVVSWAAYIALLGLGCGHMVWGSARWQGVAPSTAGWAGPDSMRVDRAIRRRRRRTWFAVNGAAVLATALWAAGGLGVVARGGYAFGWIGQLYDNLYAKVWL